VTTPDPLAYIDVMGAVHEACLGGMMGTYGGREIHVRTLTDRLNAILAANVTAAPTPTDAPDPWVDPKTCRTCGGWPDALREALRDISNMLPGSVPLPMTEEEYLRSMLMECVRTARAALKATS
jgi:hypothetical protein